MKRFISALFIVAVLFNTPILGNSIAKAATVSTAWLEMNQTSSSTSRITVSSGKLYTFVHNWGGKTIRYTIFKNGSAYQSGSVGTTNDTSQQTINVGNGEYSLRMYCGASGSNTGCSAQTRIEER